MRDTREHEQRKGEEDEEEKSKNRSPGGSKIPSVAAFWEKMVENNVCKWEGGQFEVGRKKWEAQDKKWEDGGVTLLEM